MKIKILLVALLIATSSAFAQTQSYNNASLSLDGIDDFGSIQSVFFQNVNQRDFTIEFYLKADANQSQYPGIWGKTGYWSEINVELYVPGKVQFFYATSNGGNQYFSTDTVFWKANQWDHYAIVGDGNNNQLRIYKNGVLDATTQHGIPDWSLPNNDSKIGAVFQGWVSPNIQYLKGKIDDFRVSNIARYSSNFTPPQNLTSDINTRILFDFNSINSGIVPDLSGNNNNLLLHNGAFIDPNDVPYTPQTCNNNIITPDGPTTFCSGNYVNLTSDVVGGSYQWKKNGVNITTNGTSRTYKATATGSYTCVATCNGTALTSNAIQVTTKTNAFASVTASGATSFCLGDSVTLNCTNLGSNYSVQWYRTNISMENATNYSLVVKQPGTYKVVTKNLTTGCSRISGSAITTSVNCRVAGDITSGTTTEENTTNEARFTANDLSQGVNVFPNPNNGTFTFAYDGEETGDGVLQIINTMGQSIYNSAVTIQEGGYTQEIQLGDNYNKGFYIVRLLINGSYHDSRVMVR